MSQVEGSYEAEVAYNREQPKTTLPAYKGLNRVKRAMLMDWIEKHVIDGKTMSEERLTALATEVLSIIDNG